MTSQDAAKRLEMNIKTLENPSLKIAVQRTLNDYDQQVNMEFRDKVDPDGVAWRPWSEAYRKRVEEISGFAETLDNGVDRYNSGLVLEDEYKHRRGRGGKLTGRKRMRKTLADYVGFTGESESHTMLVLTGTLYGGTLDMVHNANVNDMGFELSPAEANLPEYAMYQESLGREFLGIGEMTLEQAVEHGIEEITKQLLEVWG